jgi:hypothetical protein
MLNDSIMKPSKHHIKEGRREREYKEEGKVVYVCAKLVYMRMEIPQ